jgi:hypothetical protein
MSVFGEIAKNVGEEVAKGLEKNVAPVVKKAAKNVVDTVEGWGFKPKPGEISGTEYLDNLFAAHAISNRDSTPNKIVHNLKMNWNKQLKGNDVLLGRPSMAAEIFAKLEQVGLPRMYTGKVAKGILSNDSASQSNTTGFMQRNAKLISDSLKDMDEMQRSTFLQLLPEWDFNKSTMSDLINTASKI